MNHEKLEAFHHAPEDGREYVGVFLKDGPEIADHISTDDHFAGELVKRWSCYHDLIRQLDNLLCQLEDTGGVTKADIAEARDLLVRMGYDDKALGELADHNESTY